MRGVTEHKVTLDLSRGGIVCRIRVRRGDSFVHRVRVRLKNGGSLTLPPWLVFARAEATLPTGESVYCDCTVEGDELCFTPGYGFFAVGGGILCRIVLRGGGGEELYSPAILFEAEETALPTDLCPQEEYSPMGLTVGRVADMERRCSEYAALCRGSVIAVEEYVDREILGGEW